MRLGLLTPWKSPLHHGALRPRFRVAEAGISGARALAERGCSLAPAFPRFLWLGDLPEGCHRVGWARFLDWVSRDASRWAG